MPDSIVIGPLKLGGVLYGSGTPFTVASRYSLTSRLTAVGPSLPQPKIENSATSGVARKTRDFSVMDLSQAIWPWL
ncbi:MAG TPA: hypothetical protein VJ717_07725 [Gemmatimonadaceae bacterium]|nr:hypothetical protein [Gemmatimonadaceae bacterium]